MPDAFALSRSAKDQLSRMMREHIARHRNGSGHRARWHAIPGVGEPHVLFEIEAVVVPGDDDYVESYACFGQNATEYDEDPPCPRVVRATVIWKTCGASIDLNYEGHIIVGDPARCFFDVPTSWLEPDPVTTDNVRGFAHRMQNVDNGDCCWVVHSLCCYNNGVES